jgi:hypothetical protein
MGTCDKDGCVISSKWYHITTLFYTIFLFLPICLFCNVVIKTEEKEDQSLLFYLFYHHFYFSSSFCYYTGCFKIRDFRIQCVVGKDLVELKKFLEKKIALSEEDIKTLILFNTLQPSYLQ